MTMRSNLVLVADNATIIPQHFEKYLPVPYELFDPERSYAAGTVFFYDHYLSRTFAQQCLQSQLAQGYKVIYDYKNEHWVQKPDLSTSQSSGAWTVMELLQKFPQQHLWLHLGSTPRSIPNLNVQAVPAWYWLLTVRNWPQLPDKPLLWVDQLPRYKILCMMNQIRPWRDSVWAALDQFEGQVLRSYVERQVFLPEDPEPNISNQYRLNVNWYASTAMSLICESSVAPKTDEWGYEQETAFTDPNGVFLSEKTFKAMAMAHPFMLVASAGCLQAVKQLGFETFDELWDQSYDTVADFDRRLVCIVEQLHLFDVKQLQQPRVRQKILHNQQRLFDPSVIAAMIKNQIADPIEQFLNA
jgi:hypothetical protein